MGLSFHHAIGAKRQISGVWGQSPQESHDAVVMASCAGLSRSSRIFLPMVVPPWVAKANDRQAPALEPLYQPMYSMPASSKRFISRLRNSRCSLISRSALSKYFVEQTVAQNNSHHLSLHARLVPIPVAVAHAIPDDLTQVIAQLERHGRPGIHIKASQNLQLPGVGFTRGILRYRFCFTQRSLQSYVT